MTEREFFPLVESSFGSNGGVNLGKDLVCNAAYLTICYVDESAGGFILEVFFMVF